MHGLASSSHTHRYIHEAVYKTFVHLAAADNSIQSFWCDDVDHNFLYSQEANYLIFSSPHYEVDTCLPIKENMYYILHFNKNTVATNKPITRYNSLLQSHKAVKWVEFRYKPGPAKNIHVLDESGVQWYNSDDNSLHMPWATNIFPEQVDENIKKISQAAQVVRSSGVVFVGSVWARNVDAIKTIKDTCKELNIIFNSIRISDEDEHSRLIRESYIAPAIQGIGHISSDSKFYIPCRIFKNISFGSLAITNNIGVYNLFSKYLIIYDADIKILLKKSLKYQDDNINDYSNYKKELIRTMIYVRDNHTFINRLNSCVRYLA